MTGVPPSWTLRRQRGERALVEAGLDREWYLDRYPDVRAAKFDPVSHFLKWGAREGRHPNPLFWTEHYLSHSSAVADAGVNPLVHYLRWGWQQGYDPNPLFDSGWYLRENEDVAAAGINPLLHYLHRGAEEGRDPHPLFDTDWYFERNPDIRGTWANPLQHFLEVGGRAGCSPHILFDSLFYLESNPEIRDSGTNPLLHYLDLGAAEGRNPNNWFDNQSYIARYPDVRQSGLNPLIHYRLHGAVQGRDASPQPALLAHPRPEELEPKALLNAFQSLGDNCELGLVQKHYRSNLLGLLKFASTPLGGLIAALRAGFRDLTSPECIDIQTLAGPEEGQQEFFLVSKVYGILFHVGTRTTVQPEKFKNSEARRLEFLLGAFADDLQRAEKIFVYKINYTPAQADIEDLVAAMRAYGPTTLLWVTVATDGHPAGSVEEVSEGLMRGYIECLAPYDDIMSYSPESWRALCANAYALWLRKRSATREIALASGDQQSC
jgi:hypothetical protein